MILIMHKWIKFFFILFFFCKMLNRNEKSGLSVVSPHIHRHIAGDVSKTQEAKRLRLSLGLFLLSSPLS